MKITTLEIAGFESALKGMRNPKNSWYKNDTKVTEDGITIGENDLKLAQQLKRAGTEHAKYLRMIEVWADFDMPRYWWSEFDTYKIGVEKNSCSTMHKLLNNENPITLDMFVYCKEDEDIAQLVVNRLEELRQQFMTTGKKDTYLLLRAKRILMEGFLQLRTVKLNYAAISNVYHQRKHHRLREEWVEVFCSWVESLPYAKELIIGDK